MSVFGEIAALAIDAVFGLHGDAAWYQGGGAPIACVITIDDRDASQRADAAAPPSGYVTIEVRASDIPQPLSGSTFALTGNSEAVYRIVNRPQAVDPGGLVWTMWGEPA